MRILFWVVIKKHESQCRLRQPKKTKHEYFTFLLSWALFVVGQFFPCDINEFLYLG